MTRSTYLARIVITVVAVFYFQSCDARELDERKWILMESKHFSVHSSSSEKRTRHLLLHLEALRGFFTAAMADVDSFEEKPTQILVIGKSSDFRKLGLPANYVGFFQSDVSSNYIVVGSSNNMSQAQVILHEYVHFIVRTTEQFVYPKWWDEGYAEYVAGSKLGKMRFDVGLTNEGRLDDYSRGPLRPWEDVLETKTLAGYSRKESAIFYAQSWFLVHYLQNRKDRPPLQDSWRDYSQRLQDGAGAVEAFEHAFHLTMDELRKEIRNYRRGGRFNYLRIPLDVLVSNFKPTAVKVERRDIQNVLGRFALVGGDIERASAWFNKVLEQDSDNAMAQAGLGAALLQSGNIDAAKPYFDAAVRLAPDNAEILTEAALFEISRAQSPDAWFTGLDRIKSAEQLLLQARSIGGGNVGLDTALAYTWLNTNDDPKPSIDLLKSVILRAPSEQWALLLLAEALIKADQPADALELAESVIRYDHGESAYSSAANRIIERIESEATSVQRTRPKIDAPELPPRD